MAKEPSSMPMDTPAEPVQTRQPTQELILHAPDANEVLRRLTAAYVAGVHTLTLRTTGPPDAEVEAAVSRACRRLPGLHLVGRRPRAFVLDAEDDERSADRARTLARMATRADKLLGRAAAGIQASPPPRSLQSARMDEEVLDGLLHHLRRQVTLNGWEPTPAADREDAVPSLLVAEFLERVGDYAIQLMESGQGMGPQERTGLIGQRLVDELARARSLVRTAYEAFREEDAASADALIDEAQGFTKQVRAATLDLLGSPIRPGHLPTPRMYLGYVTMMEAIERIGLYAKSMAEVAMDRAAVRGFESAQLGSA